MDSNTEPAEFTNVPKDSAKNWTEDYMHENGMYQNRCCECKELFFGHKRRVICKECFNKPIDWEKLALKQPPKEIKNNAWPGCWADGEMTGFARCMVKEVKPLKAELENYKGALERCKEVGSVREEINKELKAELEKKHNDLLDALDLKEGNGPTALSMLKAELEREREKVLYEASEYFQEFGDRERFTSLQVQQVLMSLIKKSKN